MFVLLLIYLTIQENYVLGNIESWQLFPDSSRHRWGVISVRIQDKQR